METLKYISENYEGDERTYIDIDGDEIVSSYNLLLVAHNSSGFDSWVVLNSLVKEITQLNIIKTVRGLISLSFRSGVKIVNSCEVPQYDKFTCSKSHIKSLSGTCLNIFQRTQREMKERILIKIGVRWLARIDFCWLRTIPVDLIVGSY